RRCSWSLRCSRFRSRTAKGSLRRCGLWPTPGIPPDRHTLLAVTTILCASNAPSTGRQDVSSTIDAVVVPSGTWTFDPTHSRAACTVVYWGVAPFWGAFPPFEASLDETGLRGTAQASSIDVDND